MSAWRLVSTEASVACTVEDSRLGDLVNPADPNMTLHLQEREKKEREKKKEKKTS